MVIYDTIKRSLSADLYIFNLRKYIKRDKEDEEFRIINPKRCLKIC